MQRDIEKSDIASDLNAGVKQDLWA